MATKYTMPDFLKRATTQKAITQAAYTRWLGRKAQALAKRDQKRGHVCTAPNYREAIHAAVVASDGTDAYTGESLDWHLISTYDNEASQAGKHAYRATFALLPTVDHVVADALEATFVICGVSTNDAKNCLSVAAFLALCQKVLEHAGYHVEAPGRSPRGPTSSTAQDNIHPSEGT